MATRAPFRGLGVPLGVALLLATAGCRVETAGEALDAGALDPAASSIYGGAGIGAACIDPAAPPCRPGLACTNGRCKPSGAQTEGEPCLTAFECEEGLTCGFGGFCIPQGAGVADDPCISAAECRRGYACVPGAGLQGICAVPETTAGDVGAECAGLLQCRAGLACSPESGRCVPGSLLLHPDVFSGVGCPDERTVDFGARMRLPDDDTAADFLSTPFPTDLRRLDGRLNLADFPVPGPGPLGFDALDASLRVLETDADGASRAPLIQFRFTAPLDAASLVDRVRLVAVESGEDVPLTVSVDTAGTKYHCPHRLVVRPRVEVLLAPGTTYAALLLSGIRAADGRAARPLDALPALLDGSAARERPAVRPVVEALARALSATALPADGIVGATVFTTRAPSTLIEAVHAAVTAAPARLAETAVPCGGETVSPCAVEGSADRACGSPDPAFTEWHLRLDLPVIQRGTRPYVNAEAGGEVARTGDAVSIVARETVCAALLLPTAAPPAGGWPVLVYAHGTGGGFRAHVDALGDLATDRVVLGYDGPMHGPRQGPAPWSDPGALFFNLRNPGAGLGNAAQGIADLFAIDAFLSAHPVLELTPEVVVPVDRSRRVLWGHSQGGNAAAVALAHPGGWRGGLLTGTGGGFADGLLEKRTPTDGGLALRALLQSAEVDRDHPALDLIGQVFEPVDPLMSAAGAGERIHLLHVWGRGDTFTPDAAQRRFARATEGSLVLPPEPLPEWFDDAADLGMRVAHPPVRGNVDDGARTVVVLQAAPEPDGVDPTTAEGHFVAFRHAGTMARLRAWLTALNTEDVPRLP
jgi:hypothetical protein